MDNNKTNDAILSVRESLSHVGPLETVDPVADKDHVSSWSMEGPTSRVQQAEVWPLTKNTLTPCFTRMFSMEG